MSGVNKSYLPSRRMMPVYTTVSPPADGSAVPEFPYDPPQSAIAVAGSSYNRMEDATKLSPHVGYMKGPEFSYDPPDMRKTSDYHNFVSLHNGTKTSPSISSPAAAAAAAAATAAGYNRLSESVKSAAVNMSGYSRLQEFPYGLSGVAMPNYNYSSELYSYVSNGFPRKSRMCSYCGKVFTRSTTRRYHEKRCPLLRAAGSLLKTSEAQHAISGNNASPHALKASFSENSLPTYTPNNVLPVGSLSQSAASYYGSYSPAYLSTVSGVIDQNRNSVSGVKSEPHNVGDPSSTVPEMQGRASEVSTTRFTPEYETSTPQPRMLFSPQDRTSVSPVSIAAESLPRPGSNDTGETDPYRSDVENANDLDHTDSSYSKMTYPQNDEASRQYSFISGNSDGAPSGKNATSIACKSEHGSGSAKFAASRCSICGKVFESVRLLHAHEQLHTKFKPYACRFCGQRFLKVSMRIAHERVHIGEKPYVCAVCGLTFTRKYSVRLHMRRRHTDGPCHCRYCGKTMQTLQSLKTHLSTHSIPKSEKESLLYIGAPVGEKTNVPEGGAADENVPSQNGQDPHIEDGRVAEMVSKAGESVELEFCKLCEKVFPKSFMRYHERIHADQKPYECPTCKKRFGYKNNMKSHMKLHEGIKPYQCHVCRAKFTRGSTLRRHARRHGIFSDSVWNFFVQKRKAGKKAEQQVAPAPSSIQGHHTSSPDVTSSRPGHMESLAAVPDSSRTYDGKAYPSPKGVTAMDNIYASYSSAIATMASLPQSIYPSYPATSAFTVGYSSFHPSQVPQQSDALNLSMHTGKLHAGPSVVHGEVGDTLDDVSDMECASNKSAGSDDHRGVGVQVNLCCFDRPPPLLTPSSLSAFNSLSPMGGADGSTVPATSPSLSSSGDTFHQESVSTLLSSGRLFRCNHCECYFSEYAMYRIHQKLHVRDAGHPFMCPTCGEDCHDRMYFSLHILEHLR